jgi:hypothetical protein
MHADAAFFDLVDLHAQQPRQTIAPSLDELLDL